MQKTKKKKKKNSKKRKERISEKKKKKERGRKGKKTKGRKRRKLNLESGRKNPNKNKNRQSTNNSSVGCQDIECLNKLVQVLKMNKDTVQNFIKQKKRMLARLSVIANKKKKKSKTSASMSSLTNALGGSNTLKNKTPICSGKYNSTDGMEVSANHNFFY